MKKINLGQKDIIHFIGIGGIGMSGLAQIMKNMGFKIQGSDQNKNKNIISCLKFGIKIFIGHSLRNIKKATIVVKSTAIKFKKNIKTFVTFCYFVTSLILCCLFYENLNLNIATILIMSFILSLFYQINMFKKNKPETCLNAFKLNNLSGLILFAGIILI